MIHIAIVGLGPWGLAALDRAVTAARRRPGLRIKLTAIDAARPGPGIHDPAESPLLLLNTVAGQVDSFGAAHFGEPALPGALAFLPWVRRNGHPEATGDTFLPRVAFGRYLAFVFGVLRDAAPSNLELTVVRDEVIGVEPWPGARARLALRRGGGVVADRVLLCTGHGVAGGRAPEVGDAPSVPSAVRPYPVARLDAAIGGARSVGVAGLGLVAVDVVAALTEGRGGRFERSAEGRLVYHASGREPLIFAYSRSGIPFSCRPATTLDLATRYDPIHCTPERVAALAARRGLDLVGDVLAPIFAEMRAAYALRTLALDEAAHAGRDLDRGDLPLPHRTAAIDERVGNAPRGAARGIEALRRRLRAATLDDAATILEREVPAVAAFRPEQLVLAERLCSASDPASVRDAFVRRLAFDVAEARKGEDRSPFKTGVEILRVVRHALRAGVEHDRLTPASRALWNRVAAPRIAQLVVGPPVSRGEEWLALIDAGVLRLDVAQAPDITRSWTRAQWRAQVVGPAVWISTHLDHIVHGHLDDDPPDVASTSTANGLWRSLYADGLCSVHRDGGRTVLRIDPDGSLIDATGQTVPSIRAFGVPTEGATYFNHYLPSPRSRAGAFERLRDGVSFVSFRNETEETPSPSESVGVAAIAAGIGDGA